MLLILLSFHPWASLEATSYCQSGRTAAGVETYVGEVASNLYPLGTQIMVAPAVFGRTRFRVEDRIGWGSRLDFYTPSCEQAIVFGRRLERVRVIG